MPKEQITITLPPHIDNIFNHNSWEIDYLNNTFDDRDINQEAFYELNFQIYKNLLKEGNYDDELFLVVKRNLYYLEESGVNLKEFSFSFSKFYWDKDFIEKEVEVRGSEFDRFNLLIINEDLKKIVKYLREFIPVIRKQVLKWNFLIKMRCLSNRFFSKLVQFLGEVTRKRIQ